VGLSVLIYVINHFSYRRCAICITFFTHRQKLVEAACCNVEVIKGAGGDFLDCFSSISISLKGNF
jgi:hypothetical protein